MSTPDPVTDEGPEIELTPDQYTDELEHDIVSLIESTLGVDFSVVDMDCHVDVMQEVAVIKDTIARIGMVHFGIPEMQTHPYVIHERTPVVLWSREETHLDPNLNNKPMWWSNEDGWTPELDRATKFLGWEVSETGFNEPVGFSCAVPLRDAREMMKHYQVKVEE